MQALRAIRHDFTFEIDKAPTLTVRTDIPLFEQLPPTGVYNIVAYSKGNVVAL